jgi:DNA-binding LytR/AlgR family response regulator
VKLTLTEVPELNETEVEIRYAEMDAQVESLARKIGQAEQYLHGEENGRQYRISISHILYAESVDRKTFIYTSDGVYRSELRLYQLLENLPGGDFVQVSKSCLVNIGALESVRTLLNSRMEGVLTSGEKITISRTYIPGIKAAFAGKGSDPA